MPDAIPSDIRQRIETDFGAAAEQVEAQLLQRLSGGLPNGTHPRLLRCILFLAQKDRKLLDHFIEACIMDPRDVMLWAEYEATDTANPRRVRDFNQPFDEAAIQSKRRKR